MQARRYLVSGRVQGVSFRDATRRRANALGLVGWVRNLDDGRVEVVAQGSPGALDDLEAWCRNGPPVARVEGVEARDRPVETGLEAFSVARDARSPEAHG